jgi:hypothetical protein
MARDGRWRLGRLAAHVCIAACRIGLKVSHDAPDASSDVLRAGRRWPCISGRLHGAEPRRAPPRRSGAGIGQRVTTRAANADEWCGILAYRRFSFAYAHRFLNLRREFLSHPGGYGACYGDG